jgi:hypothetical protein
MLALRVNSGTGERDRHLSSIPRQPALSPMMLFAIRIELANVPAVQCTHEPDPASALKGKQ